MVFDQREGQKFEANLARVLLKQDYSDHLRMSFGVIKINGHLPGDPEYPCERRN
jgi:hypothetical protein